jgi:hypothetical protein
MIATKFYRAWYIYDLKEHQIVVRRLYAKPTWFVLVANDVEFNGLLWVATLEKRDQMNLPLKENLIKEAQINYMYTKKILSYVFFNFETVHRRLIKHITIVSS